MADYKAMYVKMFEASEMAINILIKAQRECEEMYLSAPEGERLPLEWTVDQEKCEDGE